MTRIFCGLVLLSAIGFVVPRASAKSIVVEKNDVTDTYNCEGGTANVKGNRDTVTLTDCSQVSITGNYNHVTLSGNSPDLDVMGNNNQVAAGHVKKISTMGNKNAVTWTSPNEDEKPSISNLGNGNSISRAKE